MNIPLSTSIVAKANFSVEVFVIAVAVPLGVSVVVATATPAVSTAAMVAGAIAPAAATPVVVVVSWRQLLLCSGLVNMESSEECLEFRPLVLAQQTELPQCSRVDCSTT